MIYRMIRQSEINGSFIALVSFHVRSVRDPAAYFLVLRGRNGVRLNKEGLRKSQAASPRLGGFPCRYDEPDAWFATKSDAGARFERACLDRLTRTWAERGKW